MNKLLNVLDAILVVCCIAASASAFAAWYTDQPSNIGSVLWPLLALLWHYDKKRYLKKIDELFNLLEKADAIIRSRHFGKAYTEAEGRRGH